MMKRTTRCFVSSTLFVLRVPWLEEYSTARQEENQTNSEQEVDSCLQVSGKTYRINHFSA